MSTELKIIECPRDAMQGIKEYIPLETKVEYMDALLKVGYDTIDCGSFVSPKAIPQMRDTAEVLSRIDLTETKSKLLVIVANTRGAVDAGNQQFVDYLGYPFSISETFQLRNTNATIEESLTRVEDILDICAKHGKEPVIYISMGFGNPYGDEWNVEICQKWVHRLHTMGVRIIALSDTIGVANPDSISYLFSHLTKAYPDVEFGAHLHTQPHNWEEKIEAAYKSGCRRFDAAIKGYGGCPMAKDDLTGNMPTEKMLTYFEKNDIDTGLDMGAFEHAYVSAQKIFV